MGGVAFAGALILGVQTSVAWRPVSMGHIDDGKPFNGGPYAGLAVGIATTPDGKTLRALTPSAAGASPVSPWNAAAVSAFVAGHATPTSEPLARFLTKNATFVFCRRQGTVCYVSRRAPLTFDIRYRRMVHHAADIRGWQDRLRANPAGVAAAGSEKAPLGAQALRRGSLN